MTPVAMIVAAWFAGGGLVALVLGRVLSRSPIEATHDGIGSPPVRAVLDRVDETA